MVSTLTSSLPHHLFGDDPAVTALNEQFCDIQSKWQLITDGTSKLSEDVLPWKQLVDSHEELSGWMGGVERRVRGLVEGVKEDGDMSDCIVELKVW